MVVEQCNDTQCSCAEHVLEEGWIDSFDSCGHLECAWSFLGFGHDRQLCPQFRQRQNLGLGNQTTRRDVKVSGGEIPQTTKAVASMATRTIRTALIILALTLAACGSDSDSTTVDVGANSNDSTAITEPDTPTAETDIQSTTTKAEGSVEGVTRFWIKPELVDCVGEAPQRCMQVAEAQDGEYLLFYDTIAGFDFVEGTSYVIDVRIDDVFDPPADASSLSYTLVEVISAE